MTDLIFNIKVRLLAYGNLRLCKIQALRLEFKFYGVKEAIYAKCRV